MLAIRMQRTGRKGYPMYRVVVQQSQRQPTSGKVVANLGTYNPHTKESTLDTEKAARFLKNGAQPSDRVVKLLQTENVTLPVWVKLASDKKQKSIKNLEKLRRNQPAPEPAEEIQAEAPVAEETEKTAAAKTAPVNESPAEPENEVAAKESGDSDEVKDEPDNKPESQEKLSL